MSEGDLLVAMRRLGNNNQEKQVRRQPRELKISVLTATNTSVLTVLMKNIPLNNKIDQPMTKME